MQAPNAQQIKQFIQVLLGAGGPLAAILVSNGVSGDKVNLILQLALYIVPPLVAMIWGAVDHTDKATIAKVANMPDVAQVVVNDNAQDGAKSAMKDSALPNVVPASEAATQKGP